MEKQRKFETVKIKKITAMEINQNSMRSQRKSVDTLTKENIKIISIGKTLSPLLFSEFFSVGIG